MIVVFSCSAMSDAFASPWTVAHQAPLPMGILQARILEWVAIPFSRGSSWPRDGTLISCIGRQVLYHPSLGEPPREPIPYGSCYLVRLLREKAMAPHPSTPAWKIPWMEKPGRLHGVAESRTWLEQLHFHFSLSCIGEGNGNPLQCSCLENPRDGGAWWAAVYGVTQRWTRLKWLSSSSSSKAIKSGYWAFGMYLISSVTHWI